MNYKVRIPDLFWYRTNILCMEACPVHTDSGKYVQLIGQGEDKEAYFVTLHLFAVAFALHLVKTLVAEEKLMNL